MDRDLCVFNKTNDLEHIKTYRNVPIYCGQTNNSHGYEYEDLVLKISKSSGIIQIGKLIPQEKLYMYSHNDSIGWVWEKHFSKLHDFILPFVKNKDVVEYGVGTCKVYNKLNVTCFKWSVVDINPLVESDDKLEVIKSSADSYHKHSDIYFHSHFLEHLYEPYDFIRNICMRSNVGTHHMFSIPNQKLWLTKGYSNSIFFEHSVVLDIEIIKAIHNFYGYELISMEYFEEHSVFFNFKKTTECVKDEYDIEITELYERNKLLLSNYVSKIDYDSEFYRNMLNGNKYNIFSAHIQTQILLGNGLPINLCESVLDNSLLKIGKKLYGYDIQIISPMNADKKLLTIVPTSPYSLEIKAQLESIGYKNIVG